MKFGAKTVLGIDISEGLINLALLKQDRDGIRLVKAASGPVPDGAIKDGNIEEPMVLARAIKELKARNRIYAARSVVSLLAKPVLLQIMELPKEAPTNIRQFIQDEVKNYVLLPGQEIAMDYCGIDSRGRLGNSRVFVVAADGRKVNEIADALVQTGLNVDAIEPPLLAWARAFYAKKIVGRFDCNVLIATLRDGVLALCVFRNQTMDFVSAKNISETKAKPPELCRWLGEQLNAIIKFYDVEVPDNYGKWEITVVAADSAQLPTDAEESLKAKVPNAALQVATARGASEDTGIGLDDASARTGASPVAIGLAMKLLAPKTGGSKINLLPPESGEVKSARKHILITANIAAVVLLLMVMLAGALALMVTRVNQSIVRKKQAQLSGDTYALLRERESLEKRIEQLSDRPALLNSISSSRLDVDWAGLLSDVRRATPRTARLTRLYTKGGSRMSLEGRSLSYKAVHLFVDMLGRSEHIESASLVETEKDDEADELIRFVILCSLYARGGQ